jgi:hypothetical protein
MTREQLPPDMFHNSRKIGDIKVKGKEDIIEIYHLFS